MTETTCIAKVKYSCFMSGRLNTHTAFLYAYCNIFLGDCQLLFTIRFGHTSKTTKNYLEKLMGPKLTQAEGFILDVGAKMFTIAGLVIVYGVSASVVYGLIYWAYIMLTGG